MARVAGIDLEDVQSSQLHGLQPTSEQPINSALKALQDISLEGGKTNLQNLFSKKEEVSLANRVSLPEDLEGALLALVPRVESAHQRTVEGHIQDIEGKQKISNTLIEARRHLSQSKEEELELTQELHQLLLTLESQDCKILDDVTRKEIEDSKDPYIFSAAQIAEMKAAVSSLSDRYKSEISRDFTTKLQPAFAEQQAVLESLKKMLELLTRLNEVQVRNQIAR